MALIIPSNYILLFSETSQHARRSLAERKLARLTRTYPAPEYAVRIEGRRRADGRFSKRGQFYTFEVWQREEEDEEDIEYTGAFDSP